jgi:hypothetical protein
LLVSQKRPRELGFTIRLSMAARDSFITVWHDFSW